MKQRSLIQVKDQVWIFPHHSDSHKIEPVIGVVLTSTGTVLIDAGNGPVQARELAEELERIAAPPVDTIIITHHHWDHVFGTSFFKPRNIIGHQAGFAHLSRYARMDWEGYIATQLENNPASAFSQKAKLQAVDDFASFQVKAPNVTFTEEMTLHLEGLTLNLQHVGGHHAADSIIVQIVEEKVVFVGDAFYPAPVTQRSEGQGYDHNVLNRMLELGADIYVHGHGAPLSLARLQKFMTQIGE